MKKNFFMVSLTILFLTACQTRNLENQYKTNITEHPVIAVVSAQQKIIGFQGIINTKQNLQYSKISTALDRVSVTWHGDAVELLSHLAQRRGYQFVWTGVRLPLPVNLNAEGVSYRNLLRLIRLQIAWRAELHEHPGQIALAFDTRRQKKAKEE